jgi:hypothetical protein
MPFGMDQDRELVGHEEANDTPGDPKAGDAIVSVAHAEPDFIEHNKTPVHAVMRQQELSAQNTVGRFPHFRGGKPHYLLLIYSNTARETTEIRSSSDFFFRS